MKYITGGGMKPATANRVHIYRVEGNVPISHREKSRAGQNEQKRIVSQSCMYEFLYTCVGCMYCCICVCMYALIQSNLVLSLFICIVGKHRHEEVGDISA